MPTTRRLSRWTARSCSPRPANWCRLALRALDRGGTLAVAGIWLSDIPCLDYQDSLFQERKLRSVTANTRADGEAFLRLAERLGVRATTVGYPMREAPRALADLEDTVGSAGPPCCTTDFSSSKISTARISVGPTRQQPPTSRAPSLIHRSTSLGLERCWTNPSSGLDASHSRRCWDKQRPACRLHSLAMRTSAVCVGRVDAVDSDRDDLLDIAGQRECLGRRLPGSGPVSPHR